LTNGNSISQLGDEIAQNALGELGISLEDALAARVQPARKPHLICICGHALNKHGDLGPGRLYCRTAQMWCPCGDPEAVLEVEDSRYFMRVTRGFGVKHALIGGLARLMELNKSARWIVSLRCQNCGSTDGPILPVAVNSLGQISDKPERLNMFTCTKCIFDAQGIPYEIELTGNG
jgi:hypothetical protein